MFNVKIINNTPPSIKDPEDTSIVEAIQTMYKNQDKWIAEINWNNYIIPLFSGAISYIYNDIISIVNSIKSNKEVFEISFLDSSFTAKWKCNIKDGMIHIQAFWFDISPAANEDKDINSVSDSLVMDKDKFISELNILINKVDRDLLSAGYNKNNLG